MITTYADARLKATPSIIDAWGDSLEPLVIPEWGYESPTHFQVPYGTTESLADDSDVMDPLICLVAKADGEVTMAPYLLAVDLMEGMEPVGPGHPEK